MSARDQIARLEGLLERVRKNAARVRSVAERRAPAPEVSTPVPPKVEAPAAVAPPPAPKPFTRLYVGVGSRDEIRPGDLVGAVTGESGIKGAQIGKIEIRDTFSVVEVQADIADQVIRSVNGTTIKGRSVRVDYDRASSRPKRPERRDDNRPPAKRKIVRRPSNDS